MAVTSESTRLHDILVYEEDDRRSREKVTILSGEDVVLGEVLGEIKRALGSESAGAGNTGNGTLSAITLGKKAKIGDYALECVSLESGVLSAPATQEGAGGNTGDGTVTGISVGSDVQEGDYVLECTSVPTGSVTVPSTGSAGSNTGNGTCESVADGGSAKPGTYTLTCIAEATDGGSFDVVDPDGVSIGTAIVGTAFTSDQIDLTLTDGGTDFAVGDTFTIDVTEADHDSGTFSVLDPAGNLMDEAGVDSAYTSNQLNFTIEDGDTDYVVGDTFTITVSEADHDSGKFSVKDPDGNLLPYAQAGTAYSNTQINFTVNDGGTDFVVGDTFTIPVEAGSGKFKALDFTAVDGGAEAAGIAIADYDAGSGDVSGVAIVRDAVIVTDDLTWPDGATAGQKTNALAELAALGIRSKDQA